MHHQIGMKAISSTSVPIVCSIWRSHGGMFSSTWHMIVNPFLGYPTTAERSDGRMTSLWNIYNANVEPDPVFLEAEESVWVA